MPEVRAGVIAPGENASNDCVTAFGVIGAVSLSNSLSVISCSIASDFTTASGSEK